MNSLIFLIGDRDPFVSIFDHDHDSITSDISKPSIYDDLSDDEVEAPKTLNALQPKFMVTSGPRSLEVSLTSDKETVQSPKAPHQLKTNLTHRS